MSENTSDAPLILGVSGLRGIVGQSLTPEVVVRYAAAFGGWLNENHGWSDRVIVASDGRAGGDWVYQAAIAGLASAGLNVEGIGVAMTPTAGLAIGEAAGAMVVTASHNPAEWNGLKCLVLVGEGSVGGRAPNAREADEIIERFRNGSATQSPYGDVGSAIEKGCEEANAYHVQICRSRYAAVVGEGDGETAAMRMRVVLDSVNCSGAEGADSLLRAIGAHAVQLHGDGSGVFPHTPEPTRENLSGEGGLCDAVPGLKADVGFAQDPDADRLAIVDEKGGYIGEEYTLVLCAMALLEAKGDQAKDSVLVTNLSTSRMIEDVAARYGARVERTPVGEANVVQRMKELGEAGERVVLGGEGNGGVIWPEVVYVRDSLSGMALTLALMARTGKTVSGLVREIESMSPGGAGYCIVKRKVDIASKGDAEPAVAAVSAWGAGVAGARVDLQDGVRVDFEEKWGGSWVHVRASNTEAIMRLICEAPTNAMAGEVLAAVEAAIAGGGG